MILYVTPLFRCVYIAPPTHYRYEVRGCEVVWVIKDKSIGHTFFDGGAATFFLPHLSESSSPDKVRVHKRTKYTVCGGSKGEKGECGSALGPDWSVELSLTGRDKHEVVMI